MLGERIKGWAAVRLTGSSHACVAVTVHERHCVHLVLNSVIDHDCVWVK